MEQQLMDLRQYLDAIPAQRGKPIWDTELGVHWGYTGYGFQTIDGKSEVGGFPVVRRPMRQWMLRITKFAQRLLDELDALDWPEGIKLLQRNWIGRSKGADVDFVIDSGSDILDGRSISNCGFLGAMGAHHKEESRVEEDGLWGAFYAVMKIAAGSAEIGGARPRAALGRPVEIHMLPAGAG